MIIEYQIFIKDMVEGYELFYESFEDVYEAIEEHSRVLRKEVLQEIIKTEMQDHIGEIDLYYLNNPHKRFDVTLEVDYT